jgi:hypothetical protein
VRNRLQYQRLYDQNGKFRSEVGSRAATSQPAPGPSQSPDSLNPTVRKRRVTGQSEE